MTGTDRQWIDKIFNVSGDGFTELALEIFNFQYFNNAIYRQFVDALGIRPADVGSLAAIPFLPIRFFKTAAVRTTQFDPEIIFESSGTTGMVASRHAVRSLALYEESFLRAFTQFYGAPRGWRIIGLLPSYLERNGSSLIYMVDRLIRESGHPESGFYLNAQDRLSALLQQSTGDNTPTLLIGVTFALLDMAEKGVPVPSNVVIMETGGMKGRRKEMVRDQLHEVLTRSFQLETIHSEYGMTELLSQAYSKGNGIFSCPPWMRILLRDEEDPLHIRQPANHAQSGAINVIDLANIYSCSFIATDDAGRLHADDSFEVLGRLDNSDLRGCSLLVL